MHCINRLGGYGTHDIDEKTKTYHLNIYRYTISLHPLQHRYNRQISCNIINTISKPDYVWAHRALLPASSENTYSKQSRQEKSCNCSHEENFRDFFYQAQGANKHRPPANHCLSQNRQQNDMPLAQSHVILHSRPLNECR